jgi:lysophospholipid acyltransferase
MGLFYLVGVFDLCDGLTTIFISSSMAYLISTYIQDPKMPWIAFTALMGHMSISHIQRQRLNDPGVIDITGAQMVLVMKVRLPTAHTHRLTIPAYRILLERA